MLNPIQKKSLTWTRKLSIRLQPNLAHVARKNIKIEETIIKLEQTAVELFSMYYDVLGLRPVCHGHILSILQRMRCQ